MDEIVLTAATGRTIGTRPSRRLRTGGGIPAALTIFNSSHPNPVMTTRIFFQTFKLIHHHQCSQNQQAMHSRNVSLACQVECIARLH